MLSLDTRLKLEEGALDAMGIFCDPVEVAEILDMDEDIIEYLIENNAYFSVVLSLDPATTQDGVLTVKCNDGPNK